MTVSLPLGWSTFTGGGENTYCGEDQNCAEPPCGSIPEPTISLDPGEGGGAELSFDCEASRESLNFEISGGVPPFIWVSTAGVLTVTGLRTASLSIAPLSQIVAFFTLMYFSIQMKCVHGSCPPISSPNLIEYVIDTRMQAYDCFGVHVPGAPNPFGGYDNLYPDLNISSPWDYPIGSDVSKRSCVLDPGAGTPLVPPTLSDPNHWSVSVSKCDITASNGSLRVTASTAGQDGMNGTVWSGAADFDETVVIGPPVEYPFCSPSGIVGFFPADKKIDIRTQSMINNKCCVTPVGTDVVITVVDATGQVAILAVPVV